MLPLTPKKLKPRNLNLRKNKKITLLLSATLAEKWQTQNFGREIVFSADLCYNSVSDENG